MGLLLLQFLLTDTCDTLPEDTLAYPQESLNTIHSNKNLETRDRVEKQSVILLSAVHLLVIVHASTG